MKTESLYVEYAENALKVFAAKDEVERNLLVDSLGDFEVKSVLDVGCGPGHQLLPFAEKKNSFCVGADIGEEVGEVGSRVFAKAGYPKNGFFVRCDGDELPFADESFDVLLCRIAIPYMDNRKAISEFARVLKPKGHFFLKMHSPWFYLGDLKRRLPSRSLKQLAFPVICFAAGTINLLSGKHPQGKFWKGKEVYQTRGFLKRELAKNNMRIVKELPDTNNQAPSFLIEKI